MHQGQFLSTLECRNNLANDQTDTGQNDVNAASEGEAAGKRPDNPVSGLGTNVQQVAEVLKACIPWLEANSAAVVPQVPGGLKPR